MKKISLLLSLVFVINFLTAQSFTIKHLENGTDYTNGEMVVKYFPAVETEDESFNLINETSHTMKIGVKMEVLEADEFFQSYFCVFTCFLPTITELPESYRSNIAPGESIQLDAHFDAVDLNEQLVFGHLKVKYTIYSDEFEDISSVTITFYNLEENGINSHNIKYETNVYPNPARNTVNVSYQLPESNANASITIFSYTGNKVKEVSLPNYENTTSVDISDLPAGIYMYTIKSNGKNIATNKLVVQ